MLGVDKIYNVALCEGRHDIADATDGFIFSSTDTVDPTNISHLNDVALTWVNTLDNECVVNIYVTGLTVALVAVLNTVNWVNSTNPYSDIRVNLWHYDRNTNSYYGQSVVDM